MWVQIVYRYTDAWPWVMEIHIVVGWSWIGRLMPVRSAVRQDSRHGGLQYGMRWLDVMVRQESCDVSARGQVRVPVPVPVPVVRAVCECRPGRVGSRERADGRVCETESARVCFVLAHMRGYTCSTVWCSVLLTRDQ